MDDLPPIKMRYIRGTKGKSQPTAIVALAIDKIGSKIEQDGTATRWQFERGHAQYFRLEKGEQTRKSAISFVNPAEFWYWLYSVIDKRRATWVYSATMLHDLLSLGLRQQFEMEVLCLRHHKSNQSSGNADCSLHRRSPIVSLEIPPTIIVATHSLTLAQLTFVDIRNYFAEYQSRLDGYKRQGEQVIQADSDTSPTRLGRLIDRVDKLSKTVADLLNWHSAQGIGKFRYTASGLAMEAFKSRFMKHKILAHDSKIIRKHERNGYFGGHVEIFRHTEIHEKSYQLDVNSLYPSVMYEGSFPVKLTDYSFGERFDTDIPSPPYNDLVAEVFIKSEFERFPYRQYGKTIYPIGEYWTILTGPELERAEAANCIRGWGKWSRYKLAPIFRDYVEHFWNLRCNYRRLGVELYERFAKILLASLYGRWAMRTPNWVTDSNVDWPSKWATGVTANADTNEAIVWRTFHDVYQVQQSRDDVSDSLIPISSFVAAAGRERMCKLRYAAGLQQVHYQAVDSLFTTRYGYDSLMEAGEIEQFKIGKLRLEDTCDYLYILGHNRYIKDGLEIISGVTSNAINKGGDLYVDDCFSGAGGFFDKEGVTGVLSHEVRKQYKRSTLAAELRDNAIVPRIIDDSPF